MLHCIYISAQELHPDFFLPAEHLKSFSDLGSLYKSDEQTSKDNSVENVFNKIKSVLNEEVVKRTSGVYLFQITGMYF